MEKLNQIGKTNPNDISILSEIPKIKFNIPIN